MRIETKYGRKIGRYRDEHTILYPATWGGLAQWGRAQEIRERMERMLWFESPGIEFAPEQLAGARGYLVNL